MKKNIGLKINNKEYLLGEYSVSDINNLYKILFENKHILIQENVEGIDEYEKDEESYFINDIRNFIDNKETDILNISKEKLVEGIVFNLNENKKVTIFSY